MRLHLRAEHRASEKRSPLTPQGAVRLFDAGHEVIVETSSHRIFGDKAFQELGCKIVESGAWTKAPRDTYILGLKGLPDAPDALRHRHIYFGHAYKGQAKAQNLLTRFRNGGGTLLDLEYLCDANSRRVVAFGHWAGSVGAALALTQWATRKGQDLNHVVKSFLPHTDESHVHSVVENLFGGQRPDVLIVGAQGRCGVGATEMCRRHGINPTLWGRSQTEILDRKALLSHDILINCVLTTHSIEPFVRPEDLALPRKLAVISDVSCDQGGPFNSLPILAKATTWDVPVQRLVPASHRHGSLDMMAIDNLASILPRESSEDFANALLPHLLDIPNENNVCWRNARQTFWRHVMNEDNDGRVAKDSISGSSAKYAP